MSADPVLLAKAEQIRDATIIGENTALRVGGLLVDLVNALGSNEDSLTAVADYLMHYNAVLSNNDDDILTPDRSHVIDLHQSRIVLLDSMGLAFDGEPYTLQVGDVYYDNGFILVKTGGGATGYAPKAGVAYINKLTGKFYEWNGAAMSELQNIGSGDIYVVDTPDADLEFSDESGNVILRLSNGGIQTKYFNSDDTATNTIKIFFVGNSFTMDAASYAPFIISAMNAGIQLTIGCSYVAGCSLQTHLSNLTNDTAAYAYYKSVNGGAWSSASSQKMSTMLSDEDWDVVVMQQNSENAGDYDSIGGTNDYLGGCITQIVTRMGRTPKFWWLLTQKKTSASYTYDTMLSIAQRVALEYPIDVIIPVGAAVEEARGTVLDSLGASSHLQADNNGHLQEGLPVLLAGYALVMTILYALKVDGTVIGNTYTFSTSPTPPAQQNGSVVGMSDANRRIAQHCAVAADNMNNYKFINHHG